MTRRLAVFLLLAAASARADDPDRVWEYAVTHKGRPVAGAKVGLTPYTYPTPGEPKAGETRFASTDDRGEFRLPRTDPGPGVYARVLARDKSGRGGYGVVHSGGKYPPTVELQDNTELTGRLTDADGKPIPGLKLAPAALGPENFARYGGRPVTLADTPAWFWEQHPSELAADGAFTLTGAPMGHSVSLRFEAPGYGAGRVWVVPGQPNTIKLQKAGAIAVRFTVPAGAEPRDVTVRLTREQAGGSSFLEASAEGTAKTGGDLTLANLPPGTYKVLFPHAGPARFFPRAVAPARVRSGETTEVKTEFEPAARVSAVLIDSKTGRPVPGAGGEVRVTLADGQFPAVLNPKAGPDGAIDVPVPAGMVAFTPSAADGYAVVKFNANRFNQRTTEAVPVAAGKSHDFGRFALVKTVDVHGTVVDPVGKPVAGAMVAVGYSGASFYSGKPIVSDDKGRFTIAGMNPEGGVVGVTARKDKLITAAPVAVDPGKPDSELRVVVSEGFAARVKARAVDGRGNPVPGATIELTHSVRYLAAGGGIAGSGIGKRVGVTGTDGRFESEVLQAGDRYTVALSAPGYRGTVSPEWVAEPGKVHDFGDLRLTRADLAATGTVTDLTGKPVPGATVFSNADGPKPTATKTDAAGRFTLGGLFDGPAYVSVRADGFRLASVPAEPGGKPVEVKLRRTTDPPAAPPVISDAHKAATAKLTRHLLERMWAERVNAKDDGQATLAAMARFDFATARMWVAEEKARTGGKSDLSAVLDRSGGGRSLRDVAKDDPDEAIALLKSAAGAEGFRALTRLGREVLPGAPDKALRLAEEAVARARAMDESSRPWALAEAGELVWRAGRKDAGKQIIEEAAALVEPLGFDELDGYKRGMVAARVALYDPAKARKLIDPIKQADEFNRYLVQCCVRAIEADLPTAKKWLADFRPGNSLSEPLARQRIAYRLARTSPDEAVAIAEAIKDKSYRMHTLAGVATRLADQDRAVTLIDAAIDSIIIDSTVYSNGGTAALMLYRAKEVGHPDLATVRDKVLAARPADPGRPLRNFDPKVQVALALALTDPDTAQALIGDAIPKAERAALDGRQDREKLIALALADPVGAVAAVDAVLATIIKREEGFQFSGLDALALVLTEPDRLTYNVARYGGLFWDFEEE